MRKLAREAVIFLLLTPLVLTAGRLAFLLRESQKPAYIPVRPEEWGKLVPIPCKEAGHYALKGEFIGGCPPADWIDLGSGLVRENLSRPAGSAFDWALSALGFGVGGFPAGFVFWLLYRAIRFAITG